MRTRAVSLYRCPHSGEALALRAGAGHGEEVRTGSLDSSSGRRYPIADGVPVFLEAGAASLADEAHEYYQSASEEYDAAIDWLCRSFYEDEAALRNRMIDLLELRPQQRVLETGCGTCRDTEHIACRLGPAGELYAQDLSANMLRVGRRRMAARAGNAPGCAVEFFLGDAAFLPFADGSFDAAFHFGGLNTFGDKKRALAEMTRVVRTGGKIVVGDEGLAPWHRGTRYGDVLLNSNRLYGNPCPLEALPESARDVCVRWFLGNAFYLIEYRVGEGAPAVDLDLPIPGKRGGTHRTRYYGVLEGVNEHTKALALNAAQRSGKSMHEWLDAVVLGAARGPVRADEVPES